jgi:hypothetical protein
MDWEGQAKQEWETNGDDGNTNPKYCLTYDVHIRDNNPRTKDAHGGLGFVFSVENNQELFERSVLTQITQNPEQPN